MCYGPVIYVCSEAYYESWIVKSRRQRLCISLRNLNFYRIATQRYDWTPSQTFNRKWVFLSIVRHAWSALYFIQHNYGCLFVTIQNSYVNFSGLQKHSGVTILKKNLFAIFSITTTVLSKINGVVCKNKWNMWFWTRKY